VTKSYIPMIPQFIKCENVH